MIAKVLSMAGMVLLVSGPALARAESENARVFGDVARSVATYTRFTVFDDVEADVDQGVVTLTGKVTMPFKLEDIENRVIKVPGVRAVRNRIQVLPVSIVDDQLRLVIAHRIYGNPSYWHYAAMVNPPIHIIVENGRVTLTGVVNSEVERAQVRSLVAGTLGVFSVDNQLKTDAEMKKVLEGLG